MRHLALTFLLSLLFTANVTAGKLLIDPNIQPSAKAVKQEVDILELDNRLDVKVTYQARRQTVLKILDNLSTITGINLYAGYNKMDWQVRDRKMNIFAKEVPLRDLMKSIARVMKFKWSVNRDADPWAYRLYMDRRLLLEAQNELKKQEQEFERQMAEKRKRVVEKYMSLKEMSDQEIEELKQNSPNLYLEAKVGLAAPLGKLLRESTQISDAILQGNQVNLRGADLSPAAKYALLQVVRGSLQLESMKEKTNKPQSRRKLPSIPDDLDIRMDEIRINIHGSANINEDSLAGIFNGAVAISLDDFITGCKLSDDDNSFERTVARDTLKCLDEGITWWEIPGDDPVRQEASYEMQHSLPGEKWIEHQPDPALAEKAKLEVKGNNLTDIQKAFADATGLAVVSDYFGRTTMGSFTLKNQEAEITKILESIENGYNYNWDKHSSIIEYRDRYWFRKRSLQIPEEKLEGWRQRLKKNGTLDIDDLSQIAMLTNDQYFANITEDEVLNQNSASDASFIATIFCGPLRLYACLDETQRKMLFSEKGFQFASLPLEKQSEASRGLFIKWMMEDPQFRLDDSVMIHASKAQKGKRYEYTFTVTMDGKEPIEHKFITPEYKEPEKK